MRRLRFIAAEREAGRDPELTHSEQRMFDAMAFPWGGLSTRTAERV